MRSYMYLYNWALKIAILIRNQTVNAEMIYMYMNTSLLHTCTCNLMVCNQFLPILMSGGGEVWEHMPFYYTLLHCCTYTVEAAQHPNCSQSPWGTLTASSWCHCGEHCWGTQGEISDTAVVHHLPFQGTFTYCIWVYGIAKVKCGVFSFVQYIYVNSIIYLKLVLFLYLWFDHSWRWA